MRKQMNSGAGLLGLALICSGSVGVAVAQDTPSGEARISYLENGVNVVRAADGETAQAVRNMPVIPGDRMATDQRGRAEVQLVDGSLVRLDFDTQVDFQNLGTPEQQPGPLTSLRLGGGDLFVQLTQSYGGSGAEFQLDTPLTAVKLLGEGLYRVDSQGPDRLRVQVYAGTAEVLWGGQPERLGEREQIELSPNLERPQRRAFDPRETDDFASWNYNRQEYYAEDRSQEYLPDQLDQYASDLDQNGSWHYSFEYHTYVWVPYVEPDWRPYYNGEWQYYPSGLTWVSYEPWGWAPYHYGRWSWNVGFGWCWLPGYVYSPAWVSWYIGYDYWGWCPIGYYGYPATVNNFFFNYHYNDRIHPTGLDPRSWTVVPVGSVVKTPVARQALSASKIRSLRGEGVIVDRLPKTNLRELRSDPKKIVGRAMEAKPVDASRTLSAGKSRGIPEDLGRSLRVEREQLAKSADRVERKGSPAQSYVRQFEALGGRPQGVPSTKGGSAGRTGSAPSYKAPSYKAPSSSAPRALPRGGSSSSKPERSYSWSSPPPTTPQPAPYRIPERSSGRSYSEPGSSSEVKRYEPHYLGSSSPERSYFYGDGHSRSGSSSQQKTPSYRSPAAPRSYGDPTSGYRRPGDSSRTVAPPSYSNPRSYQPPSSPRSYSAPSSPRSYSPPSTHSAPSAPRSYSPPTNRYSPPKSTYSMPRSYSPSKAPSSYRSAPPSSSRPSSPPPSRSSSSRSPSSKSSGSQHKH